MKVRELQRKEITDFTILDKKIYSSGQIWIKVNGKEGLVKFASDAEDLIEIISYVLGTKMGLDIAETHLVNLNGESMNIAFDYLGRAISLDEAEEIGTKNGDKCSISVNVLGEGEFLVNGRDILRENQEKFKVEHDLVEKDEDKVKRGFEHVFDTFEKLIGDKAKELKRRYIRMVFFDSFVGNPDRGGDNWVLAKKNNTYRFPKVFDNDYSFNFSFRICVGFEQVNPKVAIKYIIDNYPDEVKDMIENLKYKITPEFINEIFDSLDDKDKGRIDSSDLKEKLLLRREFILSKYKEKNLRNKQNSENSRNYLRI